MTTEKLTPQQREKIRQMSDDICNLFDWDRTLEDRIYWKDVSVKLLRIANSNQKKCPHCGKEIE